MPLNVPLTPIHEECLLDEVTLTALNLNLVDYDSSGVGDLIGIGVSLKITNDSSVPRTTGNVYFYFRDENSVNTSTYRTILKGSHENSMDLAHLALVAMSDTKIEDSSAYGAQKLDPNDGESVYLEAILFKHAMIICHEDPAFYVENHFEDEVFTVEECPKLLNLTLGGLGSAHQKIEKLPLIEEAMRAATAILKINDEHGDVVSFTALIS